MPMLFRSRKLFSVLANYKVILLCLLVVGLCLPVFTFLVSQWRVNSDFVTISHLAFSSDEVITVTPEIANAIERICVRRKLNCEDIAPFDSQRQRIEFVDVVDTIMFSEVKSPLYFLNKSLVFFPRDLYIDGNGNFSVSDSSATMFGTNYIEFRLYVPYKSTRGQVDITLEATNSSPPPIEFDIIIREVVVDTIRFDQGNGLDTMKSVQINLEPGYHRVKILYANDWFDPDKGTDRNAYIRGLTVTPHFSGL
jgi:hypothetical protein